ncbi:MAG: outer membrane beta-barrel protein [Bacteroidota bacterium]
MKTLFLYLSLALSAQLAAQLMPNTQGFFADLSLAGATVFYDEDNLDNNSNAGGLDLRLGYGFTPTFTLYATLGGYRVQGNEESGLTEDYDLGIFEIGGRFHFGKKIKPVVFYLDGGLQAFGAQLSEDPDLQLRGGGLVLGPGLLVFLNRKLALDIGLRIGAGQITEIKSNRTTIDISDQDFNYGFSRLNVGVAWYPSNR